MCTFYAAGSSGNGDASTGNCYVSGGFTDEASAALTDTSTQGLGQWQPLVGKGTSPNVRGVPAAGLGPWTEADLGTTDTRYEGT
jgi:hypothetical protein